MATGALIDVERPAEHLELGDAGEWSAGPDGPEPPASFTHAAFARWLLAATAAGIAAVAALNWYVDPTGVTGRVTPWRIAENAEVRSEKLDLYEAALRRGEQPEVLLLGSSRTMKFDPADVELLTGARAFNAAVSGGVPRDAWLFTRLVEERQGSDFPHLVWGLDIDAFRDKQLRDGLSTDPRMARFLPRSERVATAVASAGALTELQTLKATVRSVREGGADGIERSGDMDRRFSEAGFQQWSLPFPRGAAALERAVRRQIDQYAGFIFERDAYTRVEDGPLGEFEQVVRTANEHGDVPTIFLTPYHPLAERLLARYDLAAREQEVVATLRRLQRSGELRFELVDLRELESFGGDAGQFYDGVHMTPVNTRRALERLHRDGVLAPLAVGQD